jgi:hypothetical protein
MIAEHLDALARRQFLLLVLACDAFLAAAEADTLLERPKLGAEVVQA